MTFLTTREIGGLLGERWIRSPHQAVVEPWGVSTDTRADVAGACFIALAGERFDAHDCLQQAIDGGASMLVLQADRCPETIPGDGPVLLVEDTRRALWSLAEFWRHRLEATVVAITGSAGKTTVRRMLQSILEQAHRTGETGSVTASVKSFNNELGVPLTILRARPDDQFLVLEVGTNETGELARLGALVRPDIAAITCIGRAHLEGLGSLEGVADEKASLLAFLAPGGTAVVPVDDGGPLRSAVERSLPPSTRIVDFGSGAGVLNLTERHPLSGEPGQALTLADQFQATIRLPGPYNALNALVAVGLGRSLGLTDRVISAGFSELSPDPMRFSGVPLGDSGTMLYNDAYNSNPDAVKAALETFGELAAEAPRRIVILGDMLELGEEGPGLHAEVGDQLMALHARTPIDVVVLVGPLMARCEQRLVERGFCNLVVRVEQLEALMVHALASLAVDGDSLLVKGSRSMKLERIVDAIRARVDVETGTLAAPV
ncbi:MAG: UDP-N-acetylmuramoyl-tripeptide--D-alanyl-D-alanine ligase [Planctomycetota bacterium]|nr:UDP-N-acetylmuramoyl-tripeptide--D-alanyl-D-alanine ligase [Planctomycetota bacterium]